MTILIGMQDIINKAWSKLNKDGWMYCHNNFNGNALVLSKVDRKRVMLSILISHGNAGPKK